jgi:hypothetical protein
MNARADDAQEGMSALPRDAPAGIARTLVRGVHSAPTIL